MQYINFCSYVTMLAVGGDAALQAPTTLTFGPGQPTRQCLNINIPSDAITEGGEVFQVNAVSLTPAACSANPDDTQVCIRGEGKHSIYLSYRIEIIYTCADVSNNVNLYLHCMDRNTHLHTLHKLCRDSDWFHSNGLRCQ